MGQHKLFNEHLVSASGNPALVLRRKKHMEKEHGRTYAKQDKTVAGQKWTATQKRLRAEGHPNARAR